MWPFGCRRRRGEGVKASAGVRERCDTSKNAMVGVRVVTVKVANGVDEEDDRAQAESGTHPWTDVGVHVELRGDVLCAAESSVSMSKEDNSVSAHMSRLPPTMRWTSDSRRPVVDWVSYERNEDSSHSPMMSI